MPQMAPLPWLLLMISFIICFLLFIITIYFMSTPSTPSFSHPTSEPNMSWKW